MSGQRSTLPSAHDAGPASARTRTGAVRDALIDAAVRVLERDGLGALTVRAVAAEAQVAPMGVYNHLAGKDGLLAAVLIRGFDGLRAAVTIRPGAPATDRLRASGAGYRRFAKENPAMYRLMFGGSVAPEVHEAIGAHAEPAFGALVDLVAQAQHEGTLQAGDPWLLALQIWSGVHGAVSLELAGAAPVADLADAAYDGIVEVLLRGLAPH